MCEGYTDVIAFFRAGLPRAVATCGTALGEDHFRLMRNFAKRIVLAYDADSAGQSAAASVYQWERSTKLMWRWRDYLREWTPRNSPNEIRGLASGHRRCAALLQFRLERVLEGANVATAEGRARAGELAVAVLAEHPSELVRDQYVIEVADRLRLDFGDTAITRQFVFESAVHARRARSGDEAPTASSAPRTRMPRPGLEALRLYVHGPANVKERLVAPYFVHEVQREVFDALCTGQSLSVLIDALERRGQDEAAQVLSELAVDELGRPYGADDVAAVIAQLIRSAVLVELVNLNREMRDGRLSPDVRMATIRDVKERVELLDSSQGETVEVDLRAWLVERAS